jgi:hypothetical protein
MTVQDKQAWLIGGALVVTAAAWRVMNWHYGLAPNLEAVTASALVAAAFLTRRWAVIVPIAIMAVSDAVIGNTMIALFTWSAFGLIGGAGLALRRLRRRPGALVLTATGFGLAGSVFFFLYTNFGVWLLDDGAMYAKTWQGLMQCYAMGLPFYRTMLLGNLVLVPLYMAAAAYGPVLGRKFLPKQAANLSRNH